MGQGVGTGRGRFNEEPKLGDAPCQPQGIYYYGEMSSAAHTMILQELSLPGTYMLGWMCCDWLPDVMFSVLHCGAVAGSGGG